MSDHDTNMWEFSSGLPLEGQRVKSTAATFTYDQEYNADAVVLKITFQPWDGETETGEAQTQMYSVGKNWEPADEGQSLAHKSGKRQQFNNMTIISKMLHSLMEARGGGDVATGMKALITEGADPTDASTYVGWDVTMKGITYQDMKGKDKTTFGVGEWHGKVGAKSAKATAKATKLADKPAAKPATKPAAAAATEDEDTGEAMWKAHFTMPLYLKLKKAAKEANSHDDFMEAAFNLDGVTTDDKAWNKVAEKIIMEFGEDSLYETARA